LHVNKTIIFKNYVVTYLPDDEETMDHHPFPSNQKSQEQYGSQEILH
jgi:hypothetical protein